MRITSLVRAPCVAGVLLAAVSACVTSPTGRSQLLLFPETEMEAMGVAAFDELRQDLPESSDARASAYVRCVADAVTDALPSGSGSWEVVLFQEPSANAFALPGGKIGVHTGLLQVATDADQLATVIGHEVAHVLARHSNERVSTSYATQTGLQLAGSIAGGSAQGQQLMGLLGVGAQYGVVLPFSRSQESEADVVGLELMARAGFEPRASTALWQNMSRASGGQQPPEWASTHPAHGTRIARLEAEIPKVLPFYEQARAAGRRPACR